MMLSLPSWPTVMSGPSSPQPVRRTRGGAAGCDARSPQHSQIVAASAASTCVCATRSASNPRYSALSPLSAADLITSRLPRHCRRTRCGRSQGLTVPSEARPADLEDGADVSDPCLGVTRNVPVQPPDCLLPRAPNSLQELVVIQDQGDSKLLSERPRRIWVAAVTAGPPCSAEDLRSEVPAASCTCQAGALQELLDRQACPARLPTEPPEGSTGQLDLKPMFRRLAVLFGVTHGGPPVLSAGNGVGVSHPGVAAKATHRRAADSWSLAVAVAGSSPRASKIAVRLTRYLGPTEMTFTGNRPCRASSNDFVLPIPNALPAVVRSTETGKDSSSSRDISG